MTILTRGTYNKRLKRWLDDLRSGKYARGTGNLAYYDVTAKKTKYCCLGVACMTLGIDRSRQDEVFGFVFEGENQHMPESVQNYFGFESEDGSYYGAMDYTDKELSKFTETEREMLDFGSLEDLNDSGNYTFKQIADFIAKKPKGLFTWA